MQSHRIDALEEVCGVGIIYVVGLGPGDMSGLSFASWNKLQSGLPIYLRTAIHPVVPQLVQEGLSYISFDDLYETLEDFETVYRTMAGNLMEFSLHEDIIYAVPGHPMVAEQSVQYLFQKKAAGTVQIVGGQSFVDAACAALQIDPIEGLLLLDGTSLNPDFLNPRINTFVAQVYSVGIASDVKLTLMERYPDEQEVVVLRAVGVEGEQKIQRLALHELDHVAWIDHLTTIFLPRCTQANILKRDPAYMVELVHELRGPNGCPWDQAQTHQSLRKYVVEEAYEVAHAIDEGNPDDLIEELGDLLLQVFLHAEIASEFGDFTISDVYQSLAAKLIRRHPHVFGSVSARTEAQAQLAWNEAKSQEQPAQTLFPLHAVKKGLAPLRYAQAVQHSAATLGYDWTEPQGVIIKLQEEANELYSALRSGCEADIAEEFADVCFSLVNVGRWLGLDVEENVGFATRKFIGRLEKVDTLLHDKGLAWGNLSENNLEELWKIAKGKEKSPIDEEL